MIQTEPNYGLTVSIAGNVGCCSTFLSNGTEKRGDGFPLLLTVDLGSLLFCIFSPTDFHSFLNTSRYLKSLEGGRYAMAAPNQEEWIKWRTCGRKIAHHRKPKDTERMKSYLCPYCQLWHKTTRRKRIKISPPAGRRMVLRGGFWIEK
jgi:hypothetical protein